MIGAALFALTSKAYANSWASVRGVNYVPSFSRNPVQTFADYDAATVERELSWARELDLNAVRVFLHMYVWAHDRNNFLAAYDHLIGACAARGIRPLVVLFDDDFFDVDVSSAVEAAAWVESRAYRHSNWMANPGMPMLGADFTAGFALAGAFIDDVVGGTRAADARLLGYDIMNEPSRTAPFDGGLAAFIRWALNRTVTLARGVMTTVDAYSAVPPDLTRLEVRGLTGRGQACDVTR